MTAVLITAVCMNCAHAQGDVRRVEKVKNKVSSIGVDQNVTVTLLDSTKLKGRVDQIGDDYLILIDKRTADSRKVTFAQVKDVRLVSDNPFGDPRVLMGIAFLAVLTPLVIMSIGRD